LIYPGADISCEWKETGKTDARVIGAVDDGSLVLLDTYVQEKAFGKVLKSGTLDWFPPELEVTSQVSYEGKRFDFGFETEGRKGFMELKSAVSCENGWASYPDAPSERGLEHVNMLEKMAEEGVPAYVVFIVTHPDCDRFKPDDKIQPEMAVRLSSAEKAGVDIKGVKMVLTKSGELLLENSEIPINLEP
jgi:sugar fermentation stimulation protein A